MWLTAGSCSIVPASLPKTSAVALVLSVLIVLNAWQIFQCALVMMNQLLPASTLHLALTLPMCFVAIL